MASTRGSFVIRSAARSRRTLCRNQISSSSNSTTRPPVAAPGVAIILLTQHLRHLSDVGGDAPGLVTNSAGTLLIPVPISPPKMDGIEPLTPAGGRRGSGGSCHAWGNARPDRALGCVDCDARFARDRYSYQSHTMRALRAVAYLTNALQVRTLVARHQSSRRPPPRLILEIDVRERPPVGVADDEAGVRLFGDPRRRAAAAFSAAVRRHCSAAMASRASANGCQVLGAPQT